MKKSHYILPLILILCTPILTQIALMTTAVASALPPTVSWGYEKWGKRNLVVSTGTREIIDELFEIEGDIKVGTGATLLVRNSEIKLIGKGRTVTFTDANLQAQNATISSDWPFSVSFDGASSINASELYVRYGVLYIRGSTTAQLTTFNYAKESPYPQCTVIVGGSSVVTISNATLMEPRKGYKALELKGLATVTLSDSKIEDVEAQDSSQLSLSRSGILLDLSAADSSQVSISENLQEWIVKKQPICTAGVLASDSSVVTINSTRMRKATAYNSTISISNTTILEGVINAYNSSSVSLTQVTMTGTSVPPKVVAYDNSSITIANSQIKDISSVGAYNSSDLNILDSKLRDLVIQDYSNVSATNSTISGATYVSASSSSSFSTSELGLLHVYGSSSAAITNSEVQMLESYDSSQTSVSNSEIVLLRSSDSSTISVSESTVTEVFLYLNFVNGTLSNLNPIHYGSWDSHSGLTVGSGGYAPEVTLANTEVTKGWGFWFFGASKVTVRDSVIEALGISDSSTVSLVNSTLLAEPAVMPSGSLYVYWYLDVRSLESADVSVWYSNGTLAESKVTDTSGLARFTLLEKRLDASGTNPTGDYRIQAVKNGFSRETTTEVTKSELLTLTPPLQWWQEYWYVIVLVAVAVIASAAVFLMKRREIKVART